MAFEEEKQYNTLLSKVQRASHKAYTVLRAIFYGCCLFFLIMFLFILASFLFKIPGLTIVSFDPLTLIQIVVSGLLSLLLIRFAVLIMRDVVKENSLFTKVQSRRIRYMSYTLFAQIIFELASAFIMPVLYTYDQLIFSAYTSAGNEYTVFINFQTLAFAMILLCLSLVFEYGSLLQRDKDELI